MQENKFFSEHSVCQYKCSSIIQNITKLPKSVETSLARDRIGLLFNATF